MVHSKNILATELLIDSVMWIIKCTCKNDLFKIVLNVWANASDVSTFKLIFFKTLLRSDSK